LGFIRPLQLGGVAAIGRWSTPKIQLAGQNAVAAEIGKPAATARGLEENTKFRDMRINLLVLTSKITFIMMQKALDEITKLELTRY
jgi:hypothetical protein